MVELRGFEPLTFCMPYSMVSSDGVALGLITALQSRFGVWGRLARSGGIWARWSLNWSWFFRTCRSRKAQPWAIFASWREALQVGEAAELAAESGVVAYLRATARRGHGSDHHHGMRLHGRS